MKKENFIQLLKLHTMDSKEVKEYLGVVRSRLSKLKEEGRLLPIKGNLYWKEDVENYLASKKRPHKP